MSYSRCKKKVNFGMRNTSRRLEDEDDDFDDSEEEEDEAYHDIDLGFDEDDDELYEDYYWE